MTNTSRTLSITRHLKAPRATVWRCWVEGDLLKQWYAPKPWSVSVAQIDVRAGGASLVVMNGPNTDEVNRLLGQYLEVIEGERLVFTDAFIGDWMPGAGAPYMTGYVILSDAPDGGTNIEWGARHWSDEAVEQHKAMGFEFGWNAAADQLDALAAGL